MSDANQQFVVYGLYDPETDALRYIGCSTNVELRQKNHWTEKTGSKKSDWIQQLKSKGLTPKLVVLESFDSSEAMKNGEKRLISHFKSLGHDLLNHRDGGGGHTLGLAKDESEKKSKSILIRIEEDVQNFYVEEARRRRVSVAFLVRELMYRDMEEKKASKL